MMSMDGFVGIPSLFLAEVLETCTSVLFNFLYCEYLSDILISDITAFNEVFPGLVEIFLELDPASVYLFFLITGIDPRFVLLCNSI